MDRATLTWQVGHLLSSRRPWADASLRLPVMMGTLTCFPIRKWGGLATGIPLIFFLEDQERRDREVSLFMLFLLVV
jgi:hypothetical protein